MTFINVKDYGAVGDGSTNDTTAINNAINAASALTSKAVVYMPAGAYSLSSEIVPANGVDLIGAGKHLTTLLPQGVNSAIKKIGALGTPLTDCDFRDFGIDGSAQSGTYASSIKGIFIQYLLRCNFSSLWVRNTGATGIGTDFHVNCFIEKCLVENCGRLNDGTQPGGAGIGIGVGKYTLEALTIIECITRNCGRFGIFLETQTSASTSQGSRVIGCHSEGNQVGLADAGCNGLIVSGCTLINNSKDGFAVNAGSFGQGKPGVNGLVSNCEIYGNTQNGVQIDTTVDSTPGQYSIQDCRIYKNLLNGILINSGIIAALKSITIQGNDIYSNNYNGIAIQTAGAALGDFELVNNRLFNNGVTQTGNNAAAIRIANSISRISIANNKCNDNQATKTQSYGLAITSGTITDGYIANNDLRNNLTSAANFAGTFTTTILRSNPGYVLGVVSVTVTASPFTYTAGATPENLYIDGGTVSAIIKGGITLKSSTGAQVALAPNEAVTITYSVAPTIVTDRL